MEAPSKFLSPFSMIISGPSSCGKTVFISKLILNEMFEPMPSKIIWCYQHLDLENSDLFKKVTFVNSLPEIETLPRGTLLVIDDQMDKTNANVMNLFTRFVHHNDISVILVMQNMYFQSKFLRTINLNTNYLVIFKNLRDQQQILYLNNQIFPGRKRFLLDALKDCSRVSYNPLIIDLKCCCQDDLRIRSHIFPGETTIYYLPK